MSRCIDADFIKTGLKQEFCAACSSDYENNRQCCAACDIAYTMNLIDETPTADVQEVKHGHWIDKGVLENYPRPGINVYHLLCCSECGALHRVRPYCEGGWINANYCPNCGAKMDGDKDGEPNDK